MFAVSRQKTAPLIQASSLHTDVGDARPSDRRQPIRRQLPIRPAWQVICDKRGQNRGSTSGIFIRPLGNLGQTAIRAGHHHCAKPAHQRFGVQASNRMSSYLYTTPAEIDALVEGLEYVRTFFKLDQ